MTNREAAVAYINRIRNDKKREYATRYLHWLQNDCQGTEPISPSISYMAAQAVRMALTKFVPPLY